MQSDEAEATALRALAWLMAQDDLRGAFMGAAGVAEQDIRTGASDPAFLAGVLDFVMSDDRHVIAFCDNAGLPYDQIMVARHHLPGQSEPHWT